MMMFFQNVFSKRVFLNILNGCSIMVITSFCSIGAYKNLPFPSAINFSIKKIQIIQFF